jgi:hypothetical protein
MTYEIEQNISGKFDITYTNGDVITKEFYSNADGSNKQEIKSGYILKVNTLNDYKKHLINIQDKKTENLILSGFTFDGNLFSLSINAQINWSNLLNIPSSMFPLNLSTKDDNTYVLNFNNVQNFYFTALGKKNECLQLGNLVKKRINDCINNEELDLIKAEM